jgi:hypothetical protein
VKCAVTFTRDRIAYGMELFSCSQLSSLGTQLTVEDAVMMTYERMHASIIIGCQMISTEQADLLANFLRKVTFSIMMIDFFHLNGS